MFVRDFCTIAPGHLGVSVGGRSRSSEESVQISNECKNLECHDHYYHDVSNLPSPKRQCSMLLSQKASLLFKTGQERTLRPKLHGYTGCKRTCSVEQAVSCI